MAISYGRVIFAGGIFLFFSHVAYAILRGEGDAKRAMYAMMFGAILNIIIDPIFIYTLGYGTEISDMNPAFTVESEFLSKF